MAAGWAGTVSDSSGFSIFTPLRERVAALAAHWRPGKVGAWQLGC